MSNNESLCSVHINEDKVSCVRSGTNITSTTQGYLIRVKRKAFGVHWLYNTIIKKLSNYGGVSENTYILCVDLDVLDKINDNLNDPEYIRAHSVDERALILRTELTLFCHADNSYIVAVDIKNKKFLDRGTTKGLYTKMMVPTFDHGVTLYKLNNQKVNTMRTILIMAAFIVVALVTFLALFSNNGNRVGLSHVENNGTIQIQQVANNPAQINIDMPDM